MVPTLSWSTDYKNGEPNAIGTGNPPSFHRAAVDKSFLLSQNALSFDGHPL
jgi:hypothetical protein